MVKKKNWKNCFTGFKFKFQFSISKHFSKTVQTMEQVSFPKKKKNFFFWTNINIKEIKERVRTDCMFLSCHYAFQSESTLYSRLNVKELLVWSRHVIWSLSGCNWTQNQNHLVRKRTRNHLAKLPNVWVFIYGQCGSGFESSCRARAIKDLLAYL